MTFLQACLAGVAPKDGKYTEDEIIGFQTVMADSTYPLVVEFLGQLPGGRWLVRMEGKEDGEDVSKFLVESGVFAAGEIPPVTAPTFTEKAVHHQLQEIGLPAETVFDRKFLKFHILFYLNISY